MGNNEKATVNLLSKDELKKRLIANLEEARTLYNEIRFINKSEIYTTNLFNEQFVIDWQDGLNEISITKITDI